MNEKREKDVERVARAIWDASGLPHLHEFRDFYRRLAAAAIDVMRGATDDGTVGRVEAVLDALDVTSDEAEADGVRPVVDARTVSRSIRAAIGAPATVGGDDRG